MAIRFDYSRDGLRMSLRQGARLAGATPLAAALLASGAWAQYPGQISTAKKAEPELRSIAVVEWIGAEGKPTRSRIVPVAVLDQGDLQDGGVYLARPMPLALDPGVEYELQEDGKAIGLYDVRSAGEQQGYWVGFGQWKMPVKAAPKPPPRMAKIDVEDAQSDEPVLHRKHHGDDTSAGGSGGSSGPAPDPDRPTLHRPDSGNGDSSNGGSGSSGGSSGSPTTSSTDDSNGPVLHRRDSSGDSGTSGGANGGGTAGSSGSSTNSASTTDPDRPTLHRHTSDDDTASGNTPDPDRPRLNKKAESNDEAHVDSISGYVDPNRPHLKRGVYTEGGDEAPPQPVLAGMPVEMHQLVAVSDAQTIPQHLWNYSWANPDDEKNMQSALEEIARKELTPAQPPPAAAAAPVKTSTHRNAKPAATPPPPPPPLQLVDEQYRVFELAYGSGATIVLSAHTDGQGSAEKFITLIAQPDLYGNPLVLLKNVTDAAHLDDTPRMRLIDAVDAMADNRGELLFELRGTTERQFALYRVLRGQVQKLFVSGSSPIAGE